MLCGKNKFARDSITCWFENIFDSQVPYAASWSISVFFFLTDLLSELIEESSVLHRQSKNTKH